MQYMVYFKTHIPLESAYETHFMPYNNVSYYSFDYFKLHIPIYFGTAYYALKYMLDFSHIDAGKYVIKAQYSKGTLPTPHYYRQRTAVHPETSQGPEERGGGDLRDSPHRGGASRNCPHSLVLQ